MRSLNEPSPRLQKMGAILLLCSLIEGRITAMHEDRQILCRIAEINRYRELCNAGGAALNV
jgi:hypothetical protein